MNRKWSTYVQEPSDWGKSTCKQRNVSTHLCPLERAVSISGPWIQKQIPVSETTPDSGYVRNNSYVYDNVLVAVTSRCDSYKQGSHLTASKKSFGKPGRRCTGIILHCTRSDVWDSWQTNNSYTLQIKHNLGHSRCWKWLSTVPQAFLAPLQRGFSFSNCFWFPVQGDCSSLAPVLGNFSSLRALNVWFGALSPIRTTVSFVFMIAWPFLAYFPYTEKIKRGLWDHVAVCLLPLTPRSQRRLPFLVKGSVNMCTHQQI